MLSFSCACEHTVPENFNEREKNLLKLMNNKKVANAALGSLALSLSLCYMVCARSLNTFLPCPYYIHIYRHTLAHSLTYKTEYIYGKSNNSFRENSTYNPTPCEKYNTYTIYVRQCSRNKDANERTENENELEKGNTQRWRGERKRQIVALIPCKILNNKFIIIVSIGNCK